MNNNNNINAPVVRLELVKQEERRRSITIIQAKHEEEEVARSLTASDDTNSWAIIKVIVDAGKQGIHLNFVIILIIIIIDHYVLTLLVQVMPLRKIICWRCKRN